jgi:hypothetical protein
MYLKFICIWGIIMAADYLLEFRFEFLWPFWLVLRSIYDSFKYQGLVSVYTNGHAATARLMFSFSHYSSYLLHSSPISSVIYYCLFNGCFSLQVAMYGYNTFGKQVSIDEKRVRPNRCLHAFLFFFSPSCVPTERGICLGTVVLWVLFVWLEASVRLREIKTIDLCRPFAAHWYRRTP